MTDIHEKNIIIVLMFKWEILNYLITFQVTFDVHNRSLEVEYESIWLIKWDWVL